MLAEERFREIIQYVDARHAVTVQELTELLQKSESTIRRDLLELHKRGSLIKVHGGATSVHAAAETRDEALEVRRDRNIEEKKRIGEYAASLVGDRDFIYLDAGSSVDLMIDYLTCRGVVCVTNAIGHAGKLLKKGYQVILIGGKLKGKTEAIVGAEAIENLRKYHFTEGFFGTNGIHVEAGLTTPDSEEAQMKKVAMDRCSQCYVLADSSKFGEITSVTFAEMDQSTIVTTKVSDRTYKNLKNIVEVDQ